MGKWPGAIVCDSCSCIFFCPQDKDLKQYLDDCGNVINMHNVKVGVGQKAGLGGAPTHPLIVQISQEQSSCMMFLLGALGGHWEPVIFSVIRHWAQCLFGREQCLPAAK